MLNDPMIISHPLLSRLYPAGCGSLAKCARVRAKQRMDQRRRHCLIVMLLNFVLLFTLVGQTLAQAAGVDAAPADAWPMYRGTASLTGVSKSKLGPSLRQQWTFKAKEGIRSTAAITGGKVYVGCDDGRLYALDLKTGKKIWAFETDDIIESSPLVHNGRVYFGSSDGFVYALKAENGKLDWKFETEDRVLGAPNLFQPIGTGAKPALIVGSYDFRLYSLDLESGVSNWHYETANYINGSPAVSSGRTAFGGCDAVLHVIRLGKGEKEKQIDAEAYIIGSAAVVDDMAYIGHYENEFLCIDINAGKIAWKYRDRAFAYISSPAVTADRVLVGCRDKRLHCLDRKSGKRLWAFRTRGSVDSSPVVADGKVVVGSDDGNLYMVSLADGKKLWSHEIGEPIIAAPAVASGVVIIGAEDGRVYAFGPAK